MGGAYDRVFTIALVVSVVVLFRTAWRRSLGAGESVLLAALLLAAVPALGPGYGPRIAYWYIPPLLATYPLFDGGWRRIVLAFYAVTAATYVVEYAFQRALGRFAVAFAPDSSFLQRVSGRLSTPGATTVVRIPLFIAFLVLLGAGFQRLRARLPARPPMGQPPGPHRELASHLMHLIRSIPQHRLIAIVCAFAGTGIRRSRASSCHCTFKAAVRRRSSGSTTPCRSRSSPCGTTRRSCAARRLLRRRVLLRDRARPDCDGRGASVVARGAYYWGHPAYGWLAWLASAGGRPGAVPDALLVVGLLSIFVAGAAASLLASASAGRPGAASSSRSIRGSLCGAPRHERGRSVRPCSCSASWRTRAAVVGWAVGLLAGSAS